jgi:hypothetical protein
MSEQENLYQSHKQESEAHIFANFVKFLATKNDNLCFNVPRGKIEHVPYIRMKQFLIMNKEHNCPAEGPLES